MKVGDLNANRIGLGTNRLRHTAENIAFIRAAVDAGLRMIDSAHLYADGESEATLGAALSPVPPGCIVATKGGYGAGRGKPEVLRAEIEESFRRLQCDRIGLYYLHRVDPETPIEESLGTIKEYVGSGRITLVGISEVTVDQLERARAVVPIAAVQNHYNLTERKHDDVLDYCTAHSITFVPFFPLHGAESPTLKAIAEHHQATARQITLAWLLRRSPVMLPIPGTLSIEHLKENLAALRIELTDAEFDALT